MTDVKRKLVENIKRVHERIGEACAKANRDSSDVKLIAVTKYVGLDVLRVLPDCGLTELGESRVQELTKRAEMVNEFLASRPHLPSLGASPRPKWHMVGHLQRNKVRALLPWTDMIHSVDSLRLAEEIDAQGRAIDRVVDILLQVDTSQEATKHGVAVGAVTHLAEHVATLPNISLCGLMTMGPLTEDRGKIYDCFVRCRELYDEIVHEVPIGEQFRHLSMGMSHDFDVAITAGANMVRIGRALFEGLDFPETEPASLSEPRP